MGVVTLRLSRGSEAENPLCSVDWSSWWPSELQSGRGCRSSCVNETCPVFASFPPSCITSVCILVLQELDWEHYINFVLDNCETHFFFFFLVAISDNLVKSSGYPIMALPEILPFSDFMLPSTGHRDSKSYQNIFPHKQCLGWSWNIDGTLVSTKTTALIHPGEVTWSVSQMLWLSLCFRRA